jgi:peptidoglycan/xylan/chitin deacetylase (PgdA/CDA1 family)
MHPVFILLTLTTILLSLSGCRPGVLLTPWPTPVIDAAEKETPTAVTATAQPAATLMPTMTLPAAGPDPKLNPVPGVAPELPPIETVLVTHGDRSLPYIALTFDACQTVGSPTGYDQAIIRILNGTHTPATLFLGGLWMQQHPAQTRALAANPLFELGNHSWSHLDFTQLSPEEMSREILRTQDIMVQLTGRQATLFRFPFDTYTDDALAVVGQHGLRAIQADVITGDADPRISTRDIVNTTTAKAQNGSIIIMHMNTHGWHTAEALPPLIQRLRDQGYTFVTVSQLLGLAPLTNLPTYQSTSLPIYQSTHP